MRHLWFCIALIFMAGPAVALSCLRPDVARSFHRADAAPETYLVVHGKLGFDESLLPERNLRSWQGAPAETLVPAVLKGKSLSKAGFETDFDRQITLKVQCFGPWCGGAVSGIDYLAFVENDSGDFFLTLGPCGGFDFPRPDAEMLETVLRCFRGGRCEPAKRP
ncbi:MAG: hypothetical protein RI571_00280 [Roseovarius sp.]|jgi:hypothetical protein|nr:hypothetical protein [Roseovarius sp.]